MRQSPVRGPVKVATHSFPPIFMSPLLEFARRVVDQGELILKGPPAFSSKDDAAATPFLEQAFLEYRLEVAGPLIEFDCASALKAARVLAYAAWFFLNRSEPNERLAEMLYFPKKPVTASEHLSADLLLCYVPQIHRRAQARAPGDFLVERLGEILHQWPLSGVLSDVHEAPTTELDLGCHAGLWLLYAERLALHPRASWFARGPAWEYVELVFRERGQEKLLVSATADPVAEGARIDE
jgi:MoxR-vWA-beta-propeller ternary system domain bpX4